MAEVRLRRLPFLRQGIAYVFRGPLTRRFDDPPPNAFQQAVRALRNEFVCRRRMMLRIYSNLIEEGNEYELRTFVEEGFQPVRYLDRRQSLIANLTGDLGLIRANLDKKWRNCLRKAEKSGLTIVSGPELDKFDAFASVYNKMVSRKQFRPTADLVHHRTLQQHLPPAQRMQVVLALAGRAEPCAGAIYSVLGDTAIYLFGGSDDEGLQNCASYLVHWNIIASLHSEGVRLPTTSMGSTQRRILAHSISNAGWLGNRVSRSPALCNSSRLPRT